MYNGETKRKKKVDHCLKNSLFWRRSRRIRRERLPMLTGNTVSKFFAVASVTMKKHLPYQKIYK